MKPSTILKFVWFFVSPALTLFAAFILACAFALLSALLL